MALSDQKTQKNAKSRKILTPLDGYSPVTARSIAGFVRFQRVYSVLNNNNYSLNQIKNNSRFLFTRLLVQGKNFACWRNLSLHQKFIFQNISLHNIPDQEKFVFTLQLSNPKISERLRDPATRSNAFEYIRDQFTRALREIGAADPRYFYAMEIENDKPHLHGCFAAQPSNIPEIRRRLRELFTNGHRTALMLNPANAYPEKHSFAYVRYMLKNHNAEYFDFAVSTTTTREAKKILSDLRKTQKAYKTL